MGPSSLPPDVVLAAGLLALAVAVLYAVWTAANRWWRRRALAARFAHAARGEERAAAWLLDAGYTILGREVAVEYAVAVDGVETRVAVRADYVVERRGARYVAEVKTGVLAPRIETSSTRRQLLEYLVAFDADGVLLVDAESGSVHAVSFPGLETTHRA